MGRRRYGTFTPARREALRKAQLISAEKRRAQGRRATRIKYAKRTAIGVGVVAGVAGTGYAGHRLAGNQLIVSKRMPTPMKSSVSSTPPKFDAQGFRVHGGTVTTNAMTPVGARGLRVRGKSISYTSRNKKGDKTVLYAMGVRRPGVHGNKVSGHPRKVTEYKPTRADIKNMARHNRPLRHTEQYAREAMVMGHTTAHVYQNRKIEAGEAIRRTKSYVSAMQAKGKKVSAAHHMAALKYFSNQPRYTGGTVKPLKRMSRRRARRLYNRQNSFSSGPTVLGSRQRQPKAG